SPTRNWRVCERIALATSPISDREASMRFEMEGLIGATGFASGDRVVAGHGPRTPIGPMSDVMWAEPDGRRVLHAPDERVAAFVTAVYRFDAVEIGPVVVDATDGLLVRLGDDRELHL